MYLADSLAKLEQFEGKIPWMYLDTRGLVTCGVGFMLPNVGAAVVLPFRNGLASATADEITKEFCRVSAMKEGMAAAVYRGPLVLTNAFIDGKLMETVQALDRGLRMRLLDYDGLPDSWKLALIDMAFELGLSKLFSEFPHFIQAIKDRNWQAAMAHCNRKGPSMQRNDWTRECFETS